MDTTSAGSYLVVLGRLVTILPLTLAVTLLVMGRRPIGELPVFDFLVIVIMGAVVGADIADPEIDHLPTAFAVLVLAVLQWSISWARVRWHRFNRLTGFEPIVVIHRGRLLHTVLRRLNYTVEDILFQLREKGYFDPRRVEIALVEPSGRLSVLPRAGDEPVTRGDMGLSGVGGAVPILLVMDGKVVEDNLTAAAMTREKLDRALAAGVGRGGIRGTFLAYLDSQGHLRSVLYDPPHPGQAGPSPDIPRFAR